MRTYSDNLIIFLLLFAGVFGPVFLAMGKMELPFRSTTVVISCQTPKGWVPFVAEKHKIDDSPYHADFGWQIETVSGKRIVATNCFVEEEESQ